MATSPYKYTKKDNETNERHVTFGLNPIATSLVDFEKLFINKNNVFNEGIAGTLKTYKCRSIAWKIFLGLLDAGKSPTEWSKQITA